MIQKNVIVDIRGINDGEINFSSEKGVLVEQDGCATIAYDETPTDGEGSVKTNIIIEGEKITIKKTGDINSEMIFEMGCTHNSNYVTPYGKFQTEIQTKSVSIYNEGIFSAEIDYLLIFGGAENHCNVKIEVTEEKEDI